MTASAERGTTTVSERAVRRIAEQAATETLLRRGASRATGATASVHGGRAELSLGMTLPYPAPLADTVRDVQRHVTARTGQLTGLDVTSTRITVTSLAALRGPVSPAPRSDEGRTPRRWWSQRRVPVAVLTATAAAACGALAFDMVQVHTSHRAVAPWRVRAVDWLSGHGPGDPAVVAVGALTALLGAWLILLAVTPGRRRQSTVAASTARVDAAVDRSAVRSLVHDAVADVPGTGAVRVRVRRRRVSVRAGLRFGDRANTRDAVASAAGAALTACDLRRVPRLRVTVVPEPVWGPPLHPAQNTPHHHPPDRPVPVSARTPEGDT
ncbi:DUF6286 domain-containing Asp23/Gls24 family envelope stress response protein [Streptomyces acidiscabies]|uniref:DUF6286 domain-containing protein n=1 Tax=Streptomyces acidiscabies TaxID=42234 RepID=A0A0L0JSI1_9ACTN|nr:DUF6286 domain-containing protein [Streptomyces acidiscabies]KND28727.1 hypothetical protein IQ63_33020 [Streptomyces acidiscabies]